MTWTLPEMPEADDTPLVRQLLAIIHAEQERLQQLEDEIARLKGLKTRPRDRVQPAGNTFSSAPRTRSETTRLGSRQRSVSYRAGKSSVTISS